jgi:integrase
LVFPNGAGKPENYQNIRTRGFDRVQVKAGISRPALDAKGEQKTDRRGRPIMVGKYALHACRHFYASWLINRKADGGLELPLKTVQERMGHSTIVLTADLYGHLFPSQDDGSEMAEAERHFFLVPDKNTTSA